MFWVLYVCQAYYCSKCGSQRKSSSENIVFKDSLLGTTCEASCSRACRWLGSQHPSNSFCVSPSRPAFVFALTTQVSDHYIYMYFDQKWLKVHESYTCDECVCYPDLNPWPQQYYHNTKCLWWNQIEKC